MMKRYSSILLSILLLIGLVGGTIPWFNAFYTSLRNYRSPLREATLLLSPPISQKKANVVIVLIGGLGYQASQSLPLPTLAQLERAGASAVLLGIPPTYAQTSWGTLISGAPPETNDAPPVDLPRDQLHLLEIDTLFARAHQAGLQTTLIGSADWRRLISRNQLDYTFFVERPGPEADQAVLEAALPIIVEGNTPLVLVHFTQVDFAGQYQGGASSEAYRQAASTVDAYLGQISGAMDFGRSVLVLLADHGHIDGGGYGGVEAEVIRQPLVMIGDTIIPGEYSDVYQTDLAPTLATLLGLAAPAAARGRILYEMLWLDERDKVTAQLALAQQRITLAEAYIAAIEQSEIEPAEQLRADLAQAQATFISNNVTGAFELARLAQQEADNYMNAAHHSRLRAENLPHLGLALIILLAWFTIMWRRRGPYAGPIIVAVVITIALYHILFQLQGYHYSISSLKSLSELPIDITRRLGVSLLAGGGLILIFLMLANEENWLTLLGTGYGFSVLIAFVFALPLFWAFWQNGFVADWRIPAVGPTFWQITGLVETMIAAILGLLLPWPIMSLNLLINVIRRRLNETQAQTDSDALPGLHI